MKHCQDCNLDFPGSYRFCGSCGGGLSDTLPCPGCGELADARWAFCTSCGGQLSPNSNGHQALSSDVPELAGISAGQPSAFTVPILSPSSIHTARAVERESQNNAFQEWYAAPDLFEETTQTSAAPILRQEVRAKTTIAAPRVTASPEARNGKTAPALTMLAAYGQPETAAPESESRGPLLLGLLFLIFVVVLVAGGWYWLAHRASASQSLQVESTAAPQTQASSSSSKWAATSASPKSFAGSQADDEWKRLREQRVSAKPSDSSAVIASLDDAEKKYPRDYRFPYERAKLSIKGITSHHEAFGALVLAADEAIDNGKAQEMLDGLMADQDGDFYKLSRGHREWQTLAQALTNKDKRGLSGLQH